MIFINQKDVDYQKLIPNTQQTSNNYLYNMGCFSRRFLFLHSIRTLTQVVDQLKLNDNDNIKEYKITQNDLPNITSEDETIYVTKNGIDVLKQILENQADATKLTPMHLFKMIIKQNISHVIFFFILLSLQMVGKLGFSVLFQLLCSSISNNNLSYAYYYAIVCGVVWFIGHISRHNGFEQITYFSGRIKNQLVFMLYLKLSKISQFTAKTQQTGKIINLLSNDLNIFQHKLSIAFKAMTAPLTIIGICIILFSRFGIAGLFIVLIIILVFFIQILIGKYNSTIIKQLNKCKDKKMKLYIQIMEGIRFIKLYSLQLVFKNVIHQIRQKQIALQTNLAFGKSLQKAIGKVATLFATLLCFIVVDINDFGFTLTNAKIFSTLQLMVTMKVLIIYVGTTIGFSYQLQIIFQRFCSVFNIQDKKMFAIDSTTLASTKSSIELLPFPVLNGEIFMKNLTIYLQKDQVLTPTLKNINLNINKGKLIGIAGKIGAGKSALFAAILGQAPYYSGIMEKKGTIAYIEQEPVLFLNTIKENILFGSQYCQSKYKKCLQISCLNADLCILQKGDQTMVGQKGTLLSGGQKARLSLARAIYFDADIYLFDDPISAVDSKVARKIYDNVILKMKGNKTILLITHQLHFLKGCDQIIFLEEGQICERGSPKMLAHKLNQQQIKINKIEQAEDELLSSDQTQFQVKNENELIQKKQNLLRKNYSLDEDNTFINNNLNSQIKTGWKSYFNYLFYSRWSYLLLPFYFIFLFVTQAAYIIYYRLLSQYDNMQPKASIEVHRTFTSTQKLWMTLSILLIIYFVLSYLKFLTLNFTVINLNHKIQQNMVDGLIKSPCKYFDVTPSADLNTRFSNDLGNMEDLLLDVLSDSIEGPLVSLILLANVFSVGLYYLAPGVISIIVIVYLFLYSKQAVIELKNLDLRLKNPIFDMVGQMINGLVQIRIFNRRFFLLNEFVRRLNNSFRANINNSNISRAFGIIANYISSLLIWIGWIIGLSFTKASTIGLYQMSIIFLIDVTDNMQFFLKQMISFQSIIISVERVLLITRLPSQKQLVSSYDQQNFSSQKKKQLSTIKFINFSMRYRPQLPLVLNNLNFQIRPRQRVAIVGRTGAGKSSIIQAIFRIYQPQYGSIYEIGGYNALKMGLHTLRKNISVIPQTPFLFQDTIRKNLDPFQTKSDQQLWESLKQSNLKNSVQKLPEKLNTKISNSSSIFSVGQKQLLCLARAMLRKNKILVLDQATSNVDMNTDRVIQNCLKTKFRESTIITVAHRLNTIADYDKIIVMQQGSIAQIGTPFQLLRRGGIFADMVHTYNNNTTEGVRR